MTTMQSTMTVFIVLVVVVVFALLTISTLFAPSRPDAEKMSAYECGFAAITGQTRNRFTVSFYVVAMLFLVFDLEIVLLYPVAQSLTTLQDIGFWVIIVFITLLTLGFVLELGSNALKFNHRRD